MARKPAFDRFNTNWPAVNRLICDYFGRAVAVNPTVGAADEMYSYSIEVCGAEPIGAMAYFRAGLNIFDFVSDIAKWKFGSLTQFHPFSILPADTGNSHAISRPCCRARESGHPRFFPMPCTSNASSSAFTRCNRRHVQRTSSAAGNSISSMSGPCLLICPLPRSPGGSGGFTNC